MEDSIFPIEDSIAVATHGKNRDLVALGSLPHMALPVAETTIHQWIDQVIADGHAA